MTQRVDPLEVAIEVAECFAGRADGCPDPGCVVCRRHAAERARLVRVREAIPTLRRFRRAADRLAEAAREHEHVMRDFCAGDICGALREYDAALALVKGDQR